MDDDNDAWDRLLTELGNTRRFTRFSHRLRYALGWNDWLAWDGRRWERRARHVAIELAKQLVKELFSNAGRLLERIHDPAVANSDSKAIAESYRKHAYRSATAKSINAIVSLAASEPEFVSRPEDYDRDPYLLNVQNGTIDLRTGQLKPGDLCAHSPADLITKLAPVEFVPNATCPVFDACMRRVLPDEEVRTFILRWLGYCLTGDTREQLLVVCYGRGANGKTTLLRTVQELLGDYALQGGDALLIVDERSDPRRARAKLVGKRLVVCPEVEMNRALNEAQIKALTGGDLLTGANLYENEFEFVPVHKLIVATNHRPTVRGQDDGIWRRIALVPWTVQIPEDERDPDLPAKLRTEWPGILSVLVRACLDWQADGLRIPPSVRAATEAYRADEDRLADFLDERTVPVPGAFVSNEQLWSEFDDWCRRQPVKNTWTKRLFGNALDERGYPRAKRGVRGHQGLSLVPLSGHSVWLPPSTTPSSIDSDARQTVIAATDDVSTAVALHADDDDEVLF